MNLTRSQMQDDLMYLCDLLVKSHPDPFWGAGGAVNFYRRVDDIYRALPDTLSVLKYLDRIRPVVASLRDGHTKIGIAETDKMGTSHLPVDFGILADGLYVDRVSAPEHLGLLGSRLGGVNGVPVEEIGARVMARQGCDNDMQVWCRIADAFYEPELWADLLQVDTCDHLVLGLDTAGGEHLSMRFNWTLNRAALTSSSTVPMPRLRSNQLGWGFLDPDQEVAILRIGSLMRYREAGEVWLQSGFTKPLEEWYAEVFPFTSTRPTTSELEKFLTDTPSATEVLQNCLVAMAQAHTSWLVVDVRESLGGNSALADMLGLSLFGSEALGHLDAGYQVRRYSELYRENYGKLPDDDFFPGGYDFREARHWQERMPQEAPAQDALSWLDGVPTFQKAWKDLPQCRPKVLVVTSARTYSAGFDVVLTLRGLGARHVGVSSSQAPNCFIDVLRFRLPHSQISGVVSFKQSVALPQLDADVRTLVPHHVLTYDKLRAFAFDPEASIRLALTVIEDLDTGTLQRESGQVPGNGR